MKLRIVYGRADKDKTGFCIQELVQALKQKGAGSSTLLFLVPEQFTVQAEAMLFAQAEETKSILNADVINFKRMAHRVVSEVWDGNTKILDNAGRRMLLYRAVESCQSQLSLFRSATERFGLLGELLALLDETGRYCFSSEKMKEVADAIPSELPIKQKLTELSLIGQTYQSLLHENYLETKDMLDLLVEKMAEYAPYQGMRVWIDGFSGFTPQEYAILTAMLQIAEEVTITLCCDGLMANPRMESDFLRSIQQTYQHLVRIADSLQIPIEHVACQLRNEKHPTILHLEREYDNFPARVFASEKEDMEHLGIYAGKNMYSEVEFAASKIQTLCRKQGLRYRDIAVVTKQMEAYGPICKDVFEKYEIPLFMDEKRDLTRHALIKLILSAVGVVTEHFSYRAMFAYLKNGLLCYDQELLDEMENRVLAKNINSYARWTDAQRWLYDDKVLEARIAVEKEAVLKPLRALKEGMRQERNVRSQAEALYAFLMDLEVPQIINNRQSEEYVQVWNGFLSVLDKLVEALGTEHTTAERFLQLLKAGLSDCQIGKIPQAIDRVQIGDLDRTKQAGVKALFFLGMNEGVVPSSGGKEGVLTDRDRMLLKEYHVSLAPDSREQAYLEEFQIYEAMVCPRSYLFVTYAVKDNSGKSKRPSFYVNRLEAMFPQIPKWDDVITEEMYSRPMESVIAKEQAFEKLMQHLGRTEQSPVWDGVQQYFFNDSDYGPRLRAALEYQKGIQDDGTIPPVVAEEIFGKDLVTSISKVERYHNCPYAFYLDYGLKIEEREILQFNARDKGTFVHGVLEKLQNDFSPERVDTIVKEVLEENDMLSLQDDARSEALTKQISDMVKRICTILTMQNGGLFQPVAFEQQCQFPISLSDGRHAILTGTIDRIDTYQDGDDTFYRVIDYKTGNKKFKWGDVYAGTTVQLMTYLDALTKEEHKIPAGAFYFPMSESFQKVENNCAKVSALESAYQKQYKLSGVVLGELDVIKAMDPNIQGISAILPAEITKAGKLSERSNSVTRAEFETLFSHVENCISQAIEGYTGGKIAPYPVKESKKKTACSYCKFSAACGFDPAMGDCYRPAGTLKKKEVLEKFNHDN